MTMIMHHYLNYVPFSKPIVNLNIVRLSVYVCVYIYIHIQL